MDAVDAYLRAKHDVSNRLQLLSIYLSTDQKDKAAQIAAEWAQDLRAEQQFFMQPWPALQYVYVNHKVTAPYKVKLSINVNQPIAGNDLMAEELKIKLAEMDVYKQDILLSISNDDDVLKFSLQNDAASIAWQCTRK